MKPIDFGMPTLIETTDIQSCVSLCSGLGLQFVELNMNFPQYQISNLDIQVLKSLSKNVGIYFTIHLDERLDVCDFNQEVAFAYTKTVLSAIDIAKQLNIPLLNMHLSDGIYVTLPREKVYLYNQYNLFRQGRLLPLYGTRCLL